MSQYQQPPQRVAQSTQNQSNQTVRAGQQFIQQTGQQQVQRGLAFPTSSHLPEQVRSEVIRELNQILADTTILLTQARFAHWNVKGMAFYGLHDLFEEVGEMFEDQVDLVAERITALGGQALGTADIAAQNCQIPTMPTNLVTGQEYVQVLAERLAVHDANLRQAQSIVTEIDDLDTADLLSEISREVSQALWFLDAHLQTQPITTGKGATQRGGQQMVRHQQPIQQ
jgi:starvation-inducible DNA-binding protein